MVSCRGTGMSSVLKWRSRTEPRTLDRLHRQSPLPWGFLLGSVEGTRRAVYVQYYHLGSFLRLWDLSERNHDFVRYTPTPQRYESDCSPVSIGGTCGHTTAQAFPLRGMKQPRPRIYTHSSRLRPTRSSSFRFAIPHRAGVPRWTYLDVGVRVVHLSRHRSFLTGSSAEGWSMERNRGPGGDGYRRYGTISSAVFQIRISKDNLDDTPDQIASGSNQPCFPSLSEFVGFRCAPYVQPPFQQLVSFRLRSRPE